MSTAGVALSDYQNQPPDEAAQVVLRRFVRRGPRSPVAWIVGALMLGCAGASAATADADKGGLFEGRMCVRPIAGVDKAGDCGPVEVALLSGNRAVVRISDVVYRLQLHANEVDIVLMHGTMQIDGFSATYEWHGKTLQFSDPEKGVRYEIDFDPKPGKPSR